MRKLVIILFLIFGFTAIQTSAQTPAATPATSGMADIGIKANLAGGEVTAINAADNKISLMTKDGAIEIALAASTTYKRIPPENPKLAAAVDAALSDIGVGDKILVTGLVSADKKTIPAKGVYLMTKADISKRLSAEQNAWRTRGITGRVVSLNPNTQEFTIASRGLTGEQNVIVKPKSGVKYQRYAANSVRFDDSKASSFTELRIGDQIRALGDKSQDGTTFDAERVLSGAFKTVGGTITAIDTTKNEITIKELQTNKLVTIALNENSSLKKFPQEMANMMAMRMMGGAGGGMMPPGATGQPGQGGGNVVVMRPPAGNNPPAGEAAGQGQTRPAGAPGQGGGNPQTFGMRPGSGARADIEDLFERFPTTSLAELKVGDAIAVSSSSDNPARLTAIKLVSGVEPFFKVPQIASGAQRGNQGGGQSLSIPGLDGGFGNP